MSRSEEQNKFYWSKEWRLLRDYIMAKYHHVCQSCGKPAKIVHHIKWINDSNITDLNVTLNEENLVPLCHECHNRIHFKSVSVRDDLKFDEYGDVIVR